MKNTNFFEVKWMKPMPLVEKPTLERRRTFGGALKIHQVPINY